EKVMELRMECLGERHRQLAALTAQLRAKDAPLPQTALKAALSLDPVGQCADMRALQAQRVPPPDPERRPQVEAVRDQLAQARALGLVGKVGPASEAAQRAVDAARAAGYRPVLAAAMELLGVLQPR